MEEKMKSSVKEIFFKPIEYKPDPSPLIVSFENEQLKFVGNPSRLDKFMLPFTGKCFFSLQNGDERALRILTVFAVVVDEKGMKMTPELAINVIRYLHETNLITESEKTNFVTKINESVRAITQGVSSLSLSGKA